MIYLPQTGNVNPIILSLILIFYLLLVELGNKKMKKILMPTVITLTIVFLGMAITDIVNTWNRIK
jgi:hypothetical protein